LEEVEVVSSRQSLPLLKVILSFKKSSCQNKNKLFWFIRIIILFVLFCVQIFAGTGGNPYCQNVSINASYWEMQTVTPDPRFSVEVFFDFLAAMMVVRYVISQNLSKCTKAIKKIYSARVLHVYYVTRIYIFSLISFLLLNYLPQVKEEHASKHQIIPDER
jgi:hypothetical protein